VGKTTECTTSRIIKPLDYFLNAKVLELGERVIAVIERIPRILDLELLENMVNVL
jgi:hypothetical protein